VPTTTVSDTLELDLGDRLLRLSAHRSAHTDNDLHVYDVKTRTLCGSGSALRRTRSVLDGSINGWIEELQALTGVDRSARGAGSWTGERALAWPGCRHTRDTSPCCATTCATHRGGREPPQRAGKRRLY
jgi:hypothetical protein